MRTGDVAFPPGVVHHPLEAVVVHRVVFQLIQLVEVQPEAIAFGAAVYFYVL
jgi:hypothetical protein